MQARGIGKGIAFCQMPTPCAKNLLVLDLSTFVLISEISLRMTSLKTLLSNHAEVLTQILELSAVYFLLHQFTDH